MSANVIIHIDYGTEGASGLYLEKILTAYQGPHLVFAYVHSNFFESNSTAIINRVFCRYAFFFTTARAKKIYKLFDLYLSFLFIAYDVRRISRNASVSLHVSLFQSFNAYLLLIRFVSRYATVVVTIHDAVELKHDYPKLLMASRDKIIEKAQILWVHGHESRKILQYLDKKIVVLPFPLMLPSRMPSKRDEFDKITFLFVGHIRKEKGLATLLEAWNALPDSYHNRLKLRIAGTMSCQEKYDFSHLKSTEIIIRYLSDDELVDEIGNADFLVFPYIGGTNSGNFSMACAMGVPSLTSRIPVFKDSPFFIEDLSFSDKTELMNKICSISRADRSRWQRWLRKRVDDYESRYENQITNAHNEVFAKADRS